MKAVLFTVPLLLVAGTTLAGAYPNSLAMSCASTRGLVQQSGAVIIATGPNLFDRFVTDSGYCSISQRTAPAWLATADDDQCLVGQRCVDRRVKAR